MSEPTNDPVRDQSVDEPVDVATATPADPVLARIADAEAQLVGVENVDSGAAISTFDAVHQQLQDALSELDRT